jgi:hypothetical protein
MDYRPDLIQCLNNVDVFDGLPPFPLLPMIMLTDFDQFPPANGISVASKPSRRKKVSIFQSLRCFRFSSIIGFRSQSSFSWMA